MLKLITILFAGSIWAVEDLAPHTTSALGSSIVKPYYSQGLAKKKRCFLFGTSPTLATCFGSSSVGDSGESDTLIEVEISGTTSKVCCENI
jgi:hypothetical protein